MKKAGKSRRILVIALCVLSLPFVEAHAQRKTSQREQTPGTMIRESEVDYQLWESFVLMRKANDGEPAAQHELGIRYLQGKGFGPDTVKAAAWIKRAADQNFDLARYNYGIFEMNGWGVDWNPFESYRQFLRASVQDLPEANFVIGLMYTENLVIPQDWTKAYRYVQKAADEGLEPAKKALAEMDRRGVGKNDSSNARPEERVSKLRPLFVDFNVDTSSQADERTLLNALVREGSPELRKTLGMGERTSTGASGNPTAIALIGRAADGGSPEALTLLGWFSEQGVGMPRDPVVACLYYLRAVRLESQRATELLMNLLKQQGTYEELDRRAKAGDARAQYVWAGLVAARLEYRVSPEQALKFLESAAGRNQIEALIELGLCYQSGRWVQQDREKAKQLWRTASALGSEEAAIRLAGMSLFEPGRTKVDTALISFLRTHADDGSILAQVSLGYCYEKGLGVPMSKGEAARMYRNTAQRGSQSAYQALRRMHDEIRPKEKMFDVLD